MPLLAENNAYLDKNSKKYGNLLSVLKKRNERTVILRPYPSDPPSKMENTRRYYLLGLSFYKNKAYEKSIDNYILALKEYEFPIIFYQLGLCLMDAGDLENAKKSFEISNDFNFSDGVDDFYTIDANGMKREIYYSSYNIACIESL